MNSNMFIEMERKMNWLIINVVHVFYRILRILIHYILAIAYWSRDRKVPAVKNPILMMSATEIAEQIREEKLSSESVIRAFVARILEVEPYVNAVVECRFADALKEAQEADNLVKSGVLTKTQLLQMKPLLGVPFTVKSLLSVKGLSHTGCSVLFQDVRAEKDAVSVSLLKEVGAIVIATTNSSEMGMGFETQNYLYGTTCNPYCTSRTSGGSSGGESALLASAASVIGLGNDLAGSIRVPSMFTGIFGHKPTRGLVSNDGCCPQPTPGIDEFLLYTGPMCRYARDLETMMMALTLRKGEYFKLEEVDFKNLNIYYMYSFGYMPLVEKVDADVQDAIQKVVSHFETNYGSTIQEVDLPLLKRSNRIYVHNLFSFAEDPVGSLTNGKVKLNAILEAVKFLLRQSKLTVGPLTVMNDMKIPLIIKPKKVEYYKKMGEELVDQFDKLLDNKSILVLPTLPFPATYHYEIPILISSACYSNIFNVLGLPVTQCPVKQNGEGLPIGVQVVGRPGNDALTIACAVELEKAFGGWIPPK